MCFWRTDLLWRSLRARTFTAALAIALLLATLGQSQAADPEPKRVMMLHSFGLRFRPWTDYSEAFRAEMSRRASVEFQDHSLLNARRNSDKSDAPFVEYLRTLNAEQPPDLIVAIGAPAANFVQAHRTDLFPTTPMIYTAGRATPRGLRQVDPVRHRGSGDNNDAVFSRTSCTSCPLQRPLPSLSELRRVKRGGETRSPSPQHGSPTACNFAGTMNFLSRICSKTRPTFLHTARFSGLD